MAASPFLERFIQQTLALYRPGSLFGDGQAIKRFAPPPREEFIDPGDVFDDEDDGAAAA